MANTYSQIYIQIVFAVQERACLIDRSWREELFRYITGIVTNKKQKLIAIRGAGDHIHVLIALQPDMALSDLIRDIKSNSSSFTNEKRFVRGKFYWQEGFGAFSYSKSQLDSVAKYVLNQEAHHSKQSFREEYLELLTKFEVEFDERYVFNWVK